MVSSLYICGAILIIDEDDLKKISNQIQKKEIYLAINKQGYVDVRQKIEGKFKKTGLHRYLFELDKKNIDGLVIHHKDGNKLNNSRSNLSIITREQNAKGHSKSNRNKHSKYKGVINATKKNGLFRYQAYVTIDSKSKFLGSYRSEEDAAVAYDLGAIKYFGKNLAILNFPEKVYTNLTIEEWKEEKSINGSFADSRKNTKKTRIAQIEKIKNKTTSQNIESEQSEHSEHNLSKSAYSISEMCLFINMSRTQFYEHVRRGIFHEPKRLGNGRPFFTLQQVVDNLKTKKSGLGVNGEYVLFYERD